SSPRFTKWKDVKSNRTTYDAIRNTLLSDQKGLCAYCEMALTTKNRSVEHFIPCETSTKENNYDLDWSNMLAVCLDPGGLEKPNFQPLIKIEKSDFCCGKKKDNMVPDARLLNPLELPVLRLFRFNSGDGSIEPDDLACQQVGIPLENLKFTIEMLNLNVTRLKEQRLAVIEEVTETLNALDDGIIEPIDLDRQVAEMYFGDGTENWPRFFTTIRWILQEGAEQHLANISYSG
ncbi:MAG: retron system putative HNH endonuclease, partial [Microcystaceae cyanobacterium]